MNPIDKRAFDIAHDSMKEFSIIGRLKEIAGSWDLDSTNDNDKHY